MQIKTDYHNLVSVVLPVFNAQAFVGRAIDSILQQHYANIELIVINDGSTDKTDEVLRKYRHLKHVHIVTRENRGLVFSLNEGIQLANGRYIMRMDADDICDAQRIEKQVSFLQTNNLDLTGSAIETFGKRLKLKRVYPQSTDAVTFSLLFGACFAHPTVLAKREVLADNPYDETYLKIEDYELWTRLAQKGYRMGNHPDALLKYRVHWAQVSSANRQYQDRMRVGIAKNYAAHFFQHSDFNEALSLLLGRDFKAFTEAELISLNNLYAYLTTKFAAYRDVIDYQFFLCYLHNFFKDGNRISYFQRASRQKKTLIKLFNYSSTKRIPANLYRLLY